MVRPRFFAGQLLTEDDLQSLEDYVLAKNRLHNRHLFGSGVVCGLEVLCDPCGGGHVTVQPGYALDCCGNDIVLACKLSLDINAMVRDLRRDQLGGYDCGDPCADQQNKLDKVENPLREYCLYVSYCESESDPVSPYALDEPCNAQSCEASRVCEGIRFELRCPKPESSKPELISSLLHGFQDVIGLEAMSVDALSLAQLRQQVDSATKTLAKQPFEDLRSRLLDIIDRSPHLVSCKLRGKVLAVQPPASAPVQTPGAVPQPATESPLIEIFLDILKECICMAINPPCEPCDDTAVLLACVTVQDCEVVDICNMHRHFVLSPVALRYWSSFGQWERLLAAWCCGARRVLVALPGRGVGLEVGVGGLAGALTATVPRGVGEAIGQASPPSNEPAIPEADAAKNLRAIASAIAGMQPDESPNAARFLRISDAFGALGGLKPRAPSGDITDVERKTIEDAVARQVAATTSPKFEEMNKAMELRVADLKTQIDHLSTQLNTAKRRTRRDPSPGTPQ
jgi:hypothetical protein